MCGSDSGEGEECGGGECGHCVAHLRSLREESLYFLPPYSPELNPDELLNSDLKHYLQAAPRPESGRLRPPMA
ncbi:transposase [Streptomyces sp. NPDC086023]|uniref:transposase n=1 Tax=Streptomyces sp. NPDC086023 TaxID=3365746 RepID=UPI0037D4DE7D